MKKIHRENVNLKRKRQSDKVEMSYLNVLSFTKILYQISCFWEQLDLYISMLLQNDQFVRELPNGSKQ